MNRRNLLKCVGAVGMAGAVAVVESLSGCTPFSISTERKKYISREVESKGLIVGLEGLQPFSGTRADYLTKGVASELGLAQVATSGNESEHVDLVKTAYRNHQGVYIVGFSLGAGAVENLARVCDVPVDILFLLDGAGAGKISKNVRRVVEVRANAPFYFARGREYTPGDLENGKTSLRVIKLSYCDHFDVPNNAYPFVKGEISSSLQGK